jgi:hypothetical protein
MTPTEREARELFDTLDASTGRVLGRETAMPILLAALTRAKARSRAEGLREAAEIATGVDQEDPTVGSVSVCRTDIFCLSPGIHNLSRNRHKPEDAAMSVTAQPLRPNCCCAIAQTESGVSICLIWPHRLSGRLGPKRWRGL